MWNSKIEGASFSLNVPQNEDLIFEVPWSSLGMKWVFIEPTHLSLFTSPFFQTLWSRSNFSGSEAFGSCICWFKSCYFKHDGQQKLIITHPPKKQKQKNGCHLKFLTFGVSILAKRIFYLFFWQKGWPYLHLSAEWMDLPEYLCVTSWLCCVSIRHRQACHTSILSIYLSVCAHKSNKSKK